MTVEINEFFNPIWWPFYGIAFLFPILFFYRFRRFYRLKKLHEIGFQTRKGVSSKTRIQLQKYAAEFMKKQNLNVGTVTLDGGILIWWHALKQVNGSRVKCWCFRRAENNPNSMHATENWYIGVYIDCIDVDVQNVIITEARASLGLLLYVLQKDQSITLVYDNPFLNFTGTLQFINFVTNSLANR